MKIKYFIFKLWIMYSNVFELYLFTLFNFKYVLYLHHIFTDTIRNLPLTIAVILSLSFRPDEQLQDKALRLHC